MRTFLLAILFLGFVATSTALVVMLIVPEIPGVWGISGGEPVGVWQALGTIALALPLLFGGLYAGGLLWLLLACHWFTREEIESFLEAGPTTRIERWILARFSR